MLELQVYKYTRPDAHILFIIMNYILRSQIPLHIQYSMDILRAHNRESDSFRYYGGIYTLYDIQSCQSIVRTLCRCIHHYVGCSDAPHYIAIDTIKQFHKDDDDVEAPLCSRYTWCFHRKGLHNKMKGMRRLPPHVEVMHSSAEKRPNRINQGD